MNKKLPLYLLLVLCLLLAPLTLFGQEPSQAELPKTATEESLQRVDAERDRLAKIQGENAHSGMSLTILKPESLDEADDLQRETIIAQSILAAVKQAGLVTIDLDSQADSQKSRSQVLTLARDANANLALFLSYFSEGLRSTVVARLYETWNGRLIAGDVQSAQGELGLLSALDKSMTNVIAKLADQAAKIRSEWGVSSGTKQSKSVTFISPDEAATVSIAGNLLGTIVDGKLFLPFKQLALGQELIVQMSKEDYYDKQVSIVLEDQDAQIVLPALYGKNSFTAGLLWVPLSPISWGAFFRWMPLPDQWYVQAAWTMASPDDGWYEDLNHSELGDGSSDLSLFNQALLITPERSFLHRFGFETGVYLFSPADQIIKLSLGLGIEAVLAGSKDFTGGNLIFSLPVLGLELNLHPIVIGFQASIDFSVNAFAAPVLPAGAISTFLPFRVYVGYQW